MTATYNPARFTTMRENAGLSRPKLAKLIGVSVSTLVRVENGDYEFSDYLLQKIESVFPDAEKYLSGEGDTPPAAVQKKVEKSAAHQGERLRQFLSRKDIKQNRLAEMLNETPPNVNRILSSENLRSDTRASISKVLGASEEEIFGPKNLLKFELTDLVALPIFSVSDRNKIAKSSGFSLSEWLSTYNHKKQPVYYLHGGQMSGPEISNAFMLEISLYDKMQPILKPGSLAVCIMVEPKDYDFLNSTYVAVSIQSTIGVYRVVSNNLRTNDTIQFASVEGLGSAISIRRSDIDFIARITKAVVEF